MKRPQKPVRVPTDNEYRDYKGRSAPKTWKSKSDAWRCPCCNRTKRQIMRLDVQKGWVGNLANHHDHGRVMVKNNQTRSDEIVISDLMIHGSAKKLWEGDRSNHMSMGKPDKSKSDFALLQYLVMFTDKCFDQIERLFSQSEFGKRDKWKNSEYYRSRSIERAIGHIKYTNERFPETVICDLCNSLDATEKKKQNLPKDFSFSPSEISKFILQ